MGFQDYNEIINNFKEPYRLNIYNKKNKLVINNIISKIEKSKEQIIELFKNENEYWEKEYSVDKFFNIIEKYKEYEFKNNRMFGIGNIVAIQTGDPFLNIELILNSIIANCRIMIIANPTFINFNLFITTLIREELQKEQIEPNNISITELIDYKNFIEKNKKVIDCVVVNKDYDEYSFFNENLVGRVIYLDYGNINIYYDSIEYENTINEIVSNVASVDMDVYDYKIKDLEDFLKNEKNNFIFNTAIIFSKDIKKCMNLYEVIKAKNIFINTFDINKIEIGLDINDFLFEKKIIIEDGK